MESKLRCGQRCGDAPDMPNPGFEAVEE